jgi:hypothetical protein
MSECVETIVRNEELWSKWKENKCPNFERPPSETVKARKLDTSKALAGKMMGQGGRLINGTAKGAESSLCNPKNGVEMRKYLRMPKEAVDPLRGESVNITPADLPTIGDYLYSFLADMDPDQDVEDEFKKKRDEVFTWRFFRQLSNVTRPPLTTDKAK